MGLELKETNVRFSGLQLKKGFRMSCCHTWIDLAVAGHSVGIYNVLETSCKGVDGK